MSSPKSRYVTRYIGSVPQHKMQKIRWRRLTVCAKPSTSVVERFPCSFHCVGARVRLRSTDQDDGVVSRTYIRRTDLAVFDHLYQLHGKSFRLHWRIMQFISGLKIWLFERYTRNERVRTFLETLYKNKYKSSKVESNAILQWRVGDMGSVDRNPTPLPLGHPATRLIEYFSQRQNDLYVLPWTT